MDNPIHEGGCRCGRLRFRLRSDPVLTIACHCRGCQRMTASAFSLGALHPTASFEVVSGETLVGGLHGPAEHIHCSYCLSWIYTRPTLAAGVVFVRPTMLDHPDAFTPFVEFATSEKLPWAFTPAKRRFAGFPSREEFAALLPDYAIHAREAAG
ncbi:hypothetical protein DFR50_104103 [Roseiarcus fermentans]|uniref:CENP-V/GFA domain-containing protein n=1 Tax=Roseiarcus fermentans TaxID=1473586 RepID=A0A366FRP5_9HYPH|nr:GFA family protein [Roseiarcus fermentans]RBP16826.1 hypothetical protein DFR50_104103 [Roseiarcus fermentans]